MKRHAWWLALVALGGCDPVTVPPREPHEVFDFRLISDQDSLVLRWPNGSQIRVLLQPAGDAALDSLLEQGFSHAVRAWEAVGLYGDYRFARARIVEDADVILTWTGVSLPVVVSDCPPGGSNAFTTFCLTPEGDRLRPFPFLPGSGTGMISRVRFLVSIRPGSTVTPERVRALVTHELGHVLGLAQHSPIQTDIMFTDPGLRETPNARDRASVIVLYQTPPDITP